MVALLEIIVWNEILKTRRFRLPETLCLYRKNTMKMRAILLAGLMVSSTFTYADKQFTEAEVHEYRQMMQEVGEDWRADNSKAAFAKVKILAKKAFLKHNIFWERCITMAKAQKPIKLKPLFGIAKRLTKVLIPKLPH